MAIRELIKKATGPVPIIAFCATLLFALCYLILQLLNEDVSGELQLWVAILGSVGIVILVFFLITNAYSLFRQYSRNEIGSKLTVCLLYTSPSPRDS